MTEDHGHCEICSRVITIDERFCERKECHDKHQQNIKDKKKQMYLFIGVVAAVMLFSVFTNRM